MPNNFITTGTGPQDPLMQYIILAMSMDGASGDLPTDKYGHVVTSNGAAGLINTSNKKFGSGAADFDGASYLQMNSSAAGSFDFGAGVDFTIECQIYPRAYGASVAGGGMFGTLRGSRAGYVWHIGTSIDTCRLTSNVTGGWADNLVVQAGGGPPLNTWTHMVLERYGDTLKIYKNGAIVASRTGAAAWTFTCPVGGMFGCFADQGSNYFLNGLIDDLVIYKGVAKYKGAFSAPLVSQVI